MPAPVEVKEFHLKATSVDLVGSSFEGYSAGIGNEDEVGDIIMPGAFSKSIGERVASRKVKYIDQHNYSSTEKLWGTVTEAKEVPVAETDNQEAKSQGATHLLWSHFDVSSVRPAQDALKKIDERHLDGLSIGFKAIRVEYEASEEDADDPLWAWLMGRGQRKLLEVAWWETSSVIWGANTAALVVDGSVKELRRVADLVLKKGQHITREQVRETMETLGALTRQVELHSTQMQVLPNGALLTELTQRFDRTLLGAKRRRADDVSAEDLDKLAIVFEGFQAKYADRRSAGAAFVSLAQAVVEGKDIGDVVEGAAPQTDAGGTGEASPAVPPAEGGEHATQVEGEAGAGTGADTDHPAPQDPPVEETTGEDAGADGADGGSDQNQPDLAQTEEEEKQRLELELASLELIELELTNS